MNSHFGRRWRRRRRQPKLSLLLRNLKATAYHDPFLIFFEEKNLGILTALTNVHIYTRMIFEKFEILKLNRPAVRPWK